MKTHSSCLGSRVAIILISSATLLLLFVSVILFGVNSPMFRQIHQCYRDRHDMEELQESAYHHASADSSKHQGIRFDPSRQVVLKFAEHDEYQDLSHKHDSLWEDLLTENGGFLIKVDDEGVAHRHGIGMFHQLHCLQMIRRALQSRAPARGAKWSKYTRHGFSDEEDDGHNPELHMLHCLDYLRQSVLCHADDTIEPPKKDALGRGVIDGMITHQCRDNKPLYEMARHSPAYYLKGPPETGTGRSRGHMEGEEEKRSE